MPKIDTGYTSLFDYLLKEKFPFSEWFKDRFYSDSYKDESYFDLPLMNTYNNNKKRRRWSPAPNSKVQQILGGLQPIADIGKDFVDTFKPYKARYHAQRDFLQPIRGVGNIAKGVANLIVGVIGIIGVPLLFPLISFENDRDKLRNNLSLTFSWYLDGISSIVRGVTQVITTPLTWFIKMPLRGLITAIKGRTPLIEENQGIQLLVKKGDALLKVAQREAEEVTEAEYADSIRYELYRKYKKADSRKQATQIDEKTLNELLNDNSNPKSSCYTSDSRMYYPTNFSVDQRDNFKKYINLFRVKKQTTTLADKPVSTPSSSPSNNNR